MADLARTSSLQLLKNRRSRIYSNEIENYGKQERKKLGELLDEIRENKILYKKEAKRLEERISMLKEGKAKLAHIIEFQIKSKRKNKLKHGKFEFTMSSNDILSVLHNEYGGFNNPDEMEEKIRSHSRDINLLQHRIKWSMRKESLLERLIHLADQINERICKNEKSASLNFILGYTERSNMRESVDQAEDINSEPKDRSDEPFGSEKLNEELKVGEDVAEGDEAHHEEIDDDKGEEEAGKSQQDVKEGDDYDEGESLPHKQHLQAKIGDLKKSVSEPQASGHTLMDLFRDPREADLDVSADTSGSANDDYGDKGKSEYLKSVNRGSKGMRMDKPTSSNPSKRLHSPVAVETEMHGSSSLYDVFESPRERRSISSGTIEREKLQGGAIDVKIGGKSKEEGGYVDLIKKGKRVDHNFLSEMKKMRKEVNMAEQKMKEEKEATEKEKEERKKLMKYSTIVQYANNPSRDFLFRVCKSTSPDLDVGDVLNKLATVTFLKRLIDSEIESTKYENTLFRESSWVTAIVQDIVKVVGQQYLSTILSEPTRIVFEFWDILDIEPEKFSKEDREWIKERLEFNRENFTLITSEILHAVISSAGDFPDVLKYIYTYLRMSIDKWHPDISLSIIGGFIFLRMICKAFFDPIGSHLIDEEMKDDKCFKEAYRISLLISKVILNISNNAFGKRGGGARNLDFVKEFSESNVMTVQRFLDVISSLPPGRYELIKRTVFAKDYEMLQKFILKNKKRISKEDTAFFKDYKI